MQTLSLAALREPRNIEDAAKAKEVLLRARAAEAAVWVLSDPNFLEDACRLLVGLVKLGATAGGTEAGFDLCRRLRLFVLQLSPAVVAVRCLRGNVGPSEVRSSPNPSGFLPLILRFRFTGSHIKQFRVFKYVVFPSNVGRL